MSGNLGPKRITAARDYAARFAAYQHPQAIGGTKIDLSTKKATVDAAKQLIPMLVPYSTQMPDHAMALFLGLVERAPKKIGDEITKDLHASGAAVGLIHLEDGSNFKINKTHAAIVDIEDFANQRGLWAGHEPMGIIGEDRNCTPSDVYEGQTLVDAKIKERGAAPRSNDELIDLIEALRNDYRGKGPFLTVVAAAVERFEGDKASVQKTIHLDGQPAGYIKNGQGGLYHINKGPNGVRDWPDAMSMTGAFSGPVTYDGCRLDPAELQVLRDRALNYVEYGEPVPGPYGDQVDPSQITKPVFSDLETLLQELDTYLAKTPWLLISLLEHSTDAVKQKVFDQIDFDGTVNSTLSAGGTSVDLAFSSEHEYDLSDYWLDSGVFAGQAPTAVPVEVRPMSENLQCELHELQSLQNDIRVFLDTGRIGTPPAVAKPQSVSSADAVINSINSFMRQDRFVGGRPITWVAMAMIAEAPKTIADKLKTQLDAGGQDFATLKGKTASLDISKTPDAVLDAEDFFYDRGIWAGGDPSPAPQWVSMLDASIRLEGSHLDDLRESIQRLQDTGRLDNRRDDGSLDLADENAVADALHNWQDHSTYAYGHSALWAVIGIADAAPKTLADSIRSQLAAATDDTVSIRIGSFSAAIRLTGEERQDVLDFVENAGIWAGGAPRDLPKPKFAHTPQSVGEKLGNVLGDQHFTGSFAKKLKLVAKQDSPPIGLVNAPDDFLNMPEGVQCRAVWLPHLGELRWGTPEQYTILGGSNHQHISRGDAAGQHGCRQGYVTRTGDQLQIQ